MLTSGTNIRYHLNPFTSVLGDEGNQLVQGSYRFNSTINDTTEELLPIPDVYITQTYEPRFMIPERRIVDYNNLSDFQDAYRHLTTPTVLKSEQGMLYVKERIYLDQNGYIVNATIVIIGKSVFNQDIEIPIMNATTFALTDNYIEMTHRIDTYGSTMAVIGLRYFGFSGPNGDSKSLQLIDRETYAITRSWESMFFNNGVGFEFERTTDGYLKVFVTYLIDIDRLPGYAINSGPAQGTCLEQAAHVYESAGDTPGNYQDLASRYITL